MLQFVYVFVYLFVCVQAAGMDSEPDQYEEQLKGVFDCFDANGVGALSPDELVALCNSLQLGEATPTLLHTLLPDQEQDQDRTGPSRQVGPPIGEWKRGRRLIIQ